MTTIHICPLSALESVLADSGAVQMISLSGPGKSIETPTQITGGHLKLEFNDINEPRDGLIAPAPEHVKSVIDFASTWDQSHPLVIHCWMGISRSTAAAATVLLSLFPQITPQTVAQMIRQKSPMATPNPMMIAHADELLQLEGHLVDAIQNIGRGADAFEGKPFSISSQEFAA
jgi:predicted protein tyrosine phosphatase